MEQQQVEQLMKTSQEFRAGIVYACISVVQMVEKAIDGTAGDEKLLNLSLDVTRLGMGVSK